MISSLIAAVALTAGVSDPAAAFGAMPMLSGVQVSPDGSKIAAIVRADGRGGLGVFPANEEFRYLQFIGDADNQKLSKFFWKRDDKIVFSAKVPETRYGTPTVETRLFSLDTEDGDVTYLFSRSRPKGKPTVQIQDDIVSRLRGDPEHVLVSYRPYQDEDDGVFRVNVDRDTRHVLVQKPIDDSKGWYADTSGEIRAMIGLRHDKALRLRMKMSDGKWKDLSHRVAEGAPTFSIVGFPPAMTNAYVLSDHETDTAALYLFDIDNDRFTEQLFSHPTSDVSGIRLDPRTGEAIGVLYAEESGNISWFGNSKPRKTVEAIRAATGKEYVSFSSFNLTGSTATLFASDGVRPGQYLVFDYGTGQLTELPPQYPQLAGVELGEVFATSYEARDGLEIPAFVTLPPAFSKLEQAKGLPFIVLPHGGPTARDFVGFDWLAHFLANQGFGVLQMNFRGSSGYGAEFEDAGDRQFGQAMQDDITDGANWLVEQGFAAPEKMSILGASYGGYAALMGAVKTPDLFRCAVSINGVTDLPNYLADAADYVGGRYGTRHVGRLWKDRKMLAENSPARRADEVQIPILLVASEDDRVVRASHSKLMRTRLERAEKDVRYVELPQGSHYLDVNDNRVTALREIDSFLGGCR